MARLVINISERTLRERANATGAFHRLGSTMLITPAQIDTILNGVPSCHSKSIKGELFLGEGVDRIQWQTNRRSIPVQH